MTLHVYNPGRNAISVNRITTLVTAASPRCPAGTLSVTGFYGALAVAPGGRATVTVTARLGHGAPQGCQGAHFALSFSGVGTVS